MEAFTIRGPTSGTTALSQYLAAALVEEAEEPFKCHLNKNRVYKLVAIQTNFWVAFIKRGGTVIGVRWAFIAWAVLNFSLFSSGQIMGAAPASSLQPRNGSAPLDSSKNKAKLTPEQVTGLELLDSCVNGARAFQPPMRSYALLQIASTNKQFELSKAKRLLAEAFRTSLAPQEDNRTRVWLQAEILRQMLPISIDQVVTLLPSAEVEVKRQISDQLISVELAEKHLSQAMQIARNLSAQDEFPYGGGAKILAALPPGAVAEKQELFLEALASYKNHEHHTVLIGVPTFLGLVVHFGSAMPPSVALAAVTEILEQAKRDDGKNAIMLDGPNGSVQFNSAYEYKLFALLPLLEHLDNNWAAELLEQEPSVGASLQRFPEAMDSIYPSHDSAAGSSGSLNKVSQSMQASLFSGQDAGTADFSSGEMNRRVLEIINHAVDDASSAIHESMSLAVRSDNDQISPQAVALLGIARQNVTRDQDASDRALRRLDETLLGLPAGLQVEYLSIAGDLYLQMGEKENAASVVNQGFKAAQKLLEADTNSDDPNRALKAWWPSVAAYQKFVAIETRISHRHVVAVIHQISDPEIQILQIIGFARSLLGLPTPSSIVVEHHRATNSTIFSETN